MELIKDNKRYVITAGIGLVLAIIVCLTNDIFSADNLQTVYRILSDACFIPGVLILGIGVLVFVSNEGLFNGISFGLKTLGRSLSAQKGEKIREEDFHEYNQRHREKQRKVSHLFIVGGIFLILSIIFVFLFGI